MLQLALHSVTQEAHAASCGDSAVHCRTIPLCSHTVPSSAAITRSLDLRGKI